MQQNVSKIIPYPAATGPYKVFIKGKSMWQGHDVARLHISIGNSKQDGTKLAALMEWMAARFDRVDIIVSDTLQRHNIASETGLSLEAAHILAAKEGREWLARNKIALDAMPHSIITFWDDWLFHPDYESTRAELDGLYRHDETVRKAVDDKAEEFCRRRNSSAPHIAREFLLEEIAAIAIMMRECAADFYAGTWLNEIYTSIARLPVSEKLRVFRNVNFTEVDFIRNKARQQVV